MTNLNRLSLAAGHLAIAAYSLCVASPAQARRMEVTDCNQYSTAAAPLLPETIAPSPGGVDMRSGQFLYTHTDLSLGGEEGMKLERMFTPINAPGEVPYYRAFGALTQNWDLFLEEDRIQTCLSGDPSHDDFQVSVFQASRSQSFRSSFDPDDDGFVRQGGGPYSSLTFNYSNASGYRIPTQYTLHDSDGSIVSFEPLTGTIGQRRARVASVTEADGTTYSFNYDTNLRSVVSNRGYAIIFDYQNIGVNGASVVTAACILNLAVTPLPAMTTGTMCPSNVRSSSYSYTSGQLTQYTDQGGVATQIGALGGALYRPGESTPYLTNNQATGYGARYVTSQTFSDGRTYSYSWLTTGALLPSQKQIMGGTVTDNLGKTFSVLYEDYKLSNDPTYRVTAGPETVTDQLGRSKTYTYCVSPNECVPGPMLKAIDPEQNRREYTYDGHYNVTQIKRVAKPGSGLADIIEGKTYGCVPTVCAAKPTVITDARGNSTNIQYDTTHGGLLSEMKPAPTTGAARPLKLVTWAQKSAYVKNAGGTLVQAATPVWVMATETQCQTAANSSTAVCDNAAPKRVTTYEYGANGTANNLFVRGAAVTADGVTRRTCWTYDNAGNRVSETTPRAGLTSCP